MALNGGFEYREQIGPRSAGSTVLEHLAGHYRHSSRDTWLDRIHAGQVLLDGHIALSQSILKSGQWLVWKRPPWNEPEVPLSFAVLYQDEELLAVAKPSGLPTVPAGGFLDHTLLTRVQRYCREATPIHRLGRGTSGVVLFSRTRYARSVLAGAWRNREVSKIYRTLVRGAPSSTSFSIDIPIGPVPHPRLGTLHATSAQGGSAFSRVKVLEIRRPHGEEACSLLEVSIETGRPHQIRIHLAAAGHPLVGDPLYESGGTFKDPQSALPGDTGYFLHALRLGFRHPATGVPLEIECPPPPKLRLSGSPGTFNP